MTYEMVGVADQNDKTYVSKYGTYNKRIGFNFNNDVDINCANSRVLINKLFHENCWSLKVESKKMTKKQIEEKLGYKIDIIDENDSHNEKFNAFLDRLLNV